MKRHESLSLLSSDHHKGLSMAKMLMSAGSLSALEADGVYKKFKAFFESELAEHFSEEERFLVPPLTDNDLIKRMCKEHGVMKEMYNPVNTSENLGAAQQVTNYLRYMMTDLKIEL